jgi:hypothetical protein
VTRQLLADAVGLTLEQFDLQAPDVVSGVRPLGHFAQPQVVAAVLQSGSQ